MASRRLKSDRFFTHDYTPEVYSPAGLAWVEKHTMADVLVRHHPELEPRTPWQQECLRALVECQITLDFAHASAIDGLRFTARIGAPNLTLGVFQRRHPASLVAAALALDYQGYLQVEELVRRYGPDPFYVRLAMDEVLLVHHPDDIRAVLEGSPDPFASDPPGVTTRETRLGSTILPAGLEILIYNVFNHRNRDRIGYADSFAPHEWTAGAAGDDWSYNFFSHGPQGCPGPDLALLLGTAAIIFLVSAGTPRLRFPPLDQLRPLPYSLDYFTTSLVFD